MNFRQEIQALIIPIVKGLPLIIALVIGAFLFTQRTIVYTTPQYQALGSIKIDSKVNANNYQLFEDKPSAAGGAKDFMTEVEILKTRDLIEKTISTLDFDVTYYRIGNIKKSELYRNTPFKIEYSAVKKNGYNKLFYLKYLEGTTFLFSESEEELALVDTISAGDLFVHNDFIIKLQKQDSLIQMGEVALNPGDRFAFQINTMEALSKAIDASNYFVKPIDKEISIVKIYYQHEVPEKASKFVNAILNTYIKDGKENKTQRATKTLDFVSEQLNDVAQKLKNAESKLAGFKVANGIVNTKQETDATLKELMQLDIQKVNYNIQKAELNRLFTYLSSGSSLHDFSPNFESLKDPIFKEAFLKVQNYELEKKDLALKYTSTSEEIVTIESKINNLRTFINESVRNTVENLDTKYNELENAIAGVTELIQTFPDKERESVVLEREVKLQEQMYNYLMEKRTELAIAKSSDTNFHSIIDVARVPANPVWPNKALIYGLSIFFAIGLGIALSYAIHFLIATIKTREELATLVETPVLGEIHKVTGSEQNTSNAFANIYTSLEILRTKKVSDKGSVITISSMFPKEGKSFSVYNLSKAFASVGKRILVIDMDIRKSSIYKLMGIDNVDGLGAILKNEISPQQAICKTNVKNLDFIPAGQVNDIFSTIVFSPDSMSFINDLKNEYDYILIDTPPIGLVVDAVLMMHQSDFNLFLTRSRYSKIRKVKKTDALLQKYEIPNIYMAINDVKRKKLGYHYYYAASKNVKSIFSLLKG